MYLKANGGNREQVGGESREFLGNAWAWGKWEVTGDRECGATAVDIVTVVCHAYSKIWHAVNSLLLGAQAPGNSALEPLLLEPNIPNLKMMTKFWR